MGQELPQPTKPRNVILLIGDGMGLTQISAGVYFGKQSNFERFQVIGLTKTHASKQPITDSGAAATAMATGHKTYNGAIGVASDSSRVRNILEIINEKGVRSGIITTSSLTHATPASFYAHVLSRRMEEEIAVQLLHSSLDFMAGGGLKFISKRQDRNDLLPDFRKKFYVEVNALEPYDKIKKKERVAFLLAADAMPKQLDGRGDFLPNATELAMAFLNKDNASFFLMIEGAQIDWAGHANDTNYLIAEQLDFDQAIGRALDFAEKDGNTLVIVTADHETGGMALSATVRQNARGRNYDDYHQVTPGYSTKGHTATLIPVFAFGPGAELFSGIYDNTEIFHKIMKVTGWKEEGF
jgi:alkaline phosphatase